MLQKRTLWKKEQDEIEIARRKFSRGSGIDTNSRGEWIKFLYEDKVSGKPARLVLYKKGNVVRELVTGYDWLPYKF